MDGTAQAKLKLKRINAENTVAYILKNNVSLRLRSTLPYGVSVEDMWKLLEPHKALFILHDVDSRLMSMKLKEYATGLDLINDAIRLYRPVELNEE